MLIQLTDAGRALLEAQQGPVTLSKFVLGSGSNYTPSGSDTNIHGTIVYQGAPTTPTPQDVNVWKYSFFLDYLVGDFEFGEVGLYAQDGTTLFALASASDLIEKIQGTDPSTGNAIRLDMYLQIQGDNFYLWMTPAVSDNRFRLAVLPSVDTLPLPKNALPNAYTIQGSAAFDSFIAVTDTGRTWAFTEYNARKQVPIKAVTPVSITIARSAYESWMTPLYYGAVLLQIIQSVVESVEGGVRNVSSVVSSGLDTTLNFDNPLAILPNIGDLITLYLNTRELPIASPTLLGAIKIGSGLIMLPDGTMSAAPGGYILPVATTTVLGGIKVGDGLTIDVDGVLSATGGDYVLPVATDTVLGGVKQGANVTIAGDGTLSVAAPTPPYTLPIATAAVLGGVKIGANVAVSGDGTISVAAPYTLPVATTTVLGGVKQGSGVTIAGDGTLSVSGGYTLPVATTTVLGGVKQGAGVTIAGDGTLNVNAQPYDMPMYYKGAPSGGTIMARINVVRSVTLPAGLTGSICTSEFAATASTVLRIVRNLTEIGTITFAPGAQVGTFTFASQVVLVPGDILYIYNAASADATLADVSTTLVGTRAA